MKLTLAFVFAFSLEGVLTMLAQSEYSVREGSAVKTDHDPSVNSRFASQNSIKSEIRAGWFNCFYAIYLGFCSHFLEN